MKIGVICEGHTDRAVIINILKGLKGIDSSQVIPLRPYYSLDETDISELSPDTFSNWDAVKSECENQNKIDRFLSLEGNEFVVIHIDADRCEEYGVAKPKKDSSYSDKLRKSIITEVNKWLNNNYQDNLLYAIAIEETEAWILTIYDRKDSTSSADPKQKLKWLLNKKGVHFNQTAEDFLRISKDFSKQKNFIKNKYREYNKSLNDFCEEVEIKIEK